jgi:hypothetical protein
LTNFIQFILCVNPIQELWCFVKRWREPAYRRDRSAQGRAESERREVLWKSSFAARRPAKSSAARIGVLGGFAAQDFGIFSRIILVKRRLEKIPKSEAKTRLPRERAAPKLGRNQNAEKRIKKPTFTAFSAVNEFLIHV